MFKIIHNIPRAFKLEAPQFSREILCSIYKTQFEAAAAAGIWTEKEKATALKRGIIDGPHFLPKTV